MPKPTSLPSEPPGGGLVLREQVQLHGASASTPTLQPVAVPILPWEPHPLVTAEHLLQDYLFPQPGSILEMGVGEVLQPWRMAEGTPAFPGPLSSKDIPEQLRFLNPAGL